MKEKTLFKAIVVAIAIVLIVMGLNLQAFASITTTTNTKNITVSGIEAGVKVSAYQLTTVNYDYTADQPQAVPYTWNSSVKTWVDANYSTYSNPENFYKNVTSNSDEAKEFYSALSGAIKAGTVTLTAKTETATGTASYPVTDDKLTGTVTFAGCEMGTYLILIENGYKVYTPSVINLTPEFDRTSNEWKLPDSMVVTVKATNPQVTKTVTDTAKNKDNYSTKDVIPFTIVADIPTYLTGSLSKTYKVGDTLSNGLKLDESTIKVYGQKGSGNPVELTKTTDYTSSVTGTTSFEINFKYDQIKNYDKVRITYSASLAKETITIVGGAGNTNTANLTYSNNPYVADSTQTQETTNTVFTYGAEITKTDKTSGEALTGAEFELTKDSNKLYFVKTADGVYYQANSSDVGATTTLGVDNKGKLNIFGLAEGTYSLTETKAPSGYNKSAETKEIKITDADLNGALDDETGSTGIYKLTFPNSQGFQLPVTGGAGTVAFVAGGVVFVGLGIALFVIAMKKGKKVNEK